MDPSTIAPAEPTEPQPEVQPVVPPTVEEAAPVQLTLTAATEAAEAPDASQGALDPYQVLASFDFWLIALVNFAILTTLKQIAKKAKKANIFNSPLVSIIFTFLPLPLGAGLALMPGVLDQYTEGVQVMIGLTAGFLNPFVFRVLSKMPFFQGLLVVSEDSSRQAD